jgi:predicted acetyltransferase
MSNHVKIATVKEKQTILELWKPYIDELFRSFYKRPDHKDENEVYRYPLLDIYWQEDTNIPYLVFSGKKLAGFALVSYDRDYWRINEFYILPEFRRHGIAFDCAVEICRKHPGNWEISFHKYNFPGRSLWQNLADELSEEPVSTGQSSSSHDYIRFSV